MTLISCSRLIFEDLRVYENVLVTRRAGTVSIVCCTFERNISTRGHDFFSVDSIFIQSWKIDFSENQFEIHENKFFHQFQRISKFLNKFTSFWLCSTQAPGSFDTVNVGELRKCHSRGRSSIFGACQRVFGAIESRPGGMEQQTNESGVGLRLEFDGWKSRSGSQCFGPVRRSCSQDVARSQRFRLAKHLRLRHSQAVWEIGDSG